jgi:hypothetical protein
MLVSDVKDIDFEIAILAPRAASLSGKVKTTLDLHLSVVVNVCQTSCNVTTMTGKSRITAFAGQ